MEEGRGERERERERRERERDSQSIDISLLLVGAVDPLREQASLSLSQVGVGQSSGGDLERGRGRLGRVGQGKDTASSIHSTHNLICRYTTKAQYWDIQLLIYTQTRGSFEDTSLAPSPPPPPPPPPKKNRASKAAYSFHSVHVVIVGPSHNPAPCT